MKCWKLLLIILIFMLHLAIVPPSFADREQAGKNSPNFTVGQRVIWHYQSHAGNKNTYSIPAEIVKFGAKKIQIKVKRDNGEFVNRWVDAQKLDIN